MKATAHNLIRVRKLDYSGNYAYSPPDVDALLSVGLIKGVVPVETRHMEKCVRIDLLDGDCWTCVGTAEELLAAMDKAKEMKLDE